MKKICEMCHYWHYVYTRGFASLGVMMLIYELLKLISPINVFLSNNSICVFCIILLICVFYSIYGLFFPKKNITLDINKRTKLTIKQGNILDADGLKIIPVNEYFDTHLGDGIINENSIHGQFLSLYKARITELRQKIDEQLNFLAPLPNIRERTIVSGLPNNRYPLGSCVRIKIDNSSYLLIAVTRFNKYEHVEVSTEEFPEIIRKMFNGIEQLHDGMSVYLPLVGNGISGYELTDMQIIYVIVQAANMANKLSLTNGIYLYVFSKEQMKSINLNVVKYLYNRWKTLK